jgi:hypothetical protein
MSCAKVLPWAMSLGVPLTNTSMGVSLTQNEPCQEAGHQTYHPARCL